MLASLTFDNVFHLKNFVIDVCVVLEITVVEQLRQFSSDGLDRRL